MTTSSPVAPLAAAPSAAAPSAAAPPAAAPSHSTPPLPPLVLPGLLLAGLLAAILLRNAVGGAGVARSAPAALVFAGVLTGLALLAFPPVRRPLNRRLVRGAAAAVAAGLVGALVLCVPALVSAALSALPTGSADGWPASVRPFEGFLAWAAVVTIVASAEEIFLRGALFRLLEPRGTLAAIGVPAVAFAALHLPLYGWGAMPLDLAVGVWLGALRVVSGSVLAPAVAHVGADWVAYWLV